jgi:hypothetical protein
MVEGWEGDARVGRRHETCRDGFEGFPNSIIRKERTMSYAKRVPNMESEDARQQFLVSMYDQMWNNTTRHITLVWQPITVIFSIIGSILAIELQNLNFFITSIIVFLAYLVIGWFLAHIYDSSCWVNRNLVIITNIEKQFLVSSDSNEIHPYFNLEHNKREMLEHFKIQYFLGIVFALAVTIYYVGKVFQVGFCFPYAIFIPSAGIIISAIYVYKVRQLSKNKFKELAEKSPGKKEYLKI